MDASARSARSDRRSRAAFSIAVSSAARGENERRPNANADVFCSDVDERDDETRVGVDWRCASQPRGAVLAEREAEARTIAPLGERGIRLLVGTQPLADLGQDFLDEGRASSDAAFQVAQPLTIDPVLGRSPPPRQRTSILSVGTDGSGRVRRSTGTRARA